MMNKHLFILILALFVIFSNEKITGSFLQLIGQGAGTALMKAAKNAGQDLVIVGGTGLMAGYNKDNVCVNHRYEFPNTTKQNLLQFMYQAKHVYKMNVIVGLLWIPVPEAAYEWDAVCQDVYVRYMEQHARMLEVLLKDYDYDWYIMQEAYLNMLPLSDPQCNKDGEIKYLRKVSEALHKVNPKRKILISPYFQNFTSPEDIAIIHDTLLKCAPHITFSAPQDGVGSFDIPVPSTAKYFEEMHKRHADRLWANVETFEPKAKICHTASKERIERQVKNVTPFAKKVIHFWAYNLPGAPNDCPYSFLRK